MKKWQSKEEFKARCHEWAKKIDVDVRVISIRVMKNKWASFAVGSRLLIFNAELLRMDKKLGDYVIVHELLHFAVPNHGRLWKSLMRAHLGDYDKLEERLKRKKLIKRVRQNTNIKYKTIKERMILPKVKLRKIKRQYPIQEEVIISGSKSCRRNKK